MAAEIRVIQFQGKNGGFAANESTMWRIEIVGVNGKIKRVDTRTIDQQRQMGFANEWSELTGFPVVQYIEKETVTCKLERKIK